MKELPNTNEMLTIVRLTADERELVRRCLHATVDGPFFAEPEFHTLMGVSRAEARAVATAWPNVNERDETVALTVNNALLNLLGYPHCEEAAWHRLIQASPAEVQQVLAKWRSSTSRHDIE